MSSHIFVDETKRAGYVIAAVTVSDTEAIRKTVRALVLPGQRRIHMKHEQARRRRVIVSALAACRSRPRSTTPRVGTGPIWQPAPHASLPLSRTSPPATAILGS